MRTPKQLRIERERQASSDALNRYILQQQSRHGNLRSRLSASYFSFGITLLIMGAAVVGIVKTGGL